MSTASGPVSLKSYEPSDRAQLVWLLSILPRIYPQGDVWLARKLDDVLKGKARCTLAVTGTGLVIGVTIETPKGRRVAKLSTLFVHESFRERGVGGLLLGAARDRWIENGIQRVHGTLDAGASSQVLPNLQKIGFVAESVEKDRYGDGRDEAVVVWTPRTAGS